MSKKEIDMFAGLIDDEELDNLVGASGDVQPNTTPIITTTVPISAVSAVTFNAAPCPTSACTNKCTR